MSSKIEIANLALNFIGEAPIISLTDNVQGARVISLLFDPCRDAVLRLHPWNFAVKRQRLAARAEAPAFEFTRAFALPSDFLRVLQLNSGDTRYQIEAGGLLTNASEALLRYVARIEDTAKYDPLFVQALAAYLAMRAAVPIVNSLTQQQRAKEILDEALQDARSVDGMENPPEVFAATTFLEARLGDEDDPLFRPIKPVT